MHHDGLLIYPHKLPRLIPYILFTVQDRLFAVHLEFWLGTGSCAGSVNASVSSFFVQLKESDFYIILL